MLTDFYKGKSVFVTGHTGFKGSWLSLWLHELGAQVTGFALPPATEPNHCDLLSLTKLVRHIEGDIRDLQAVQKAIAAARPQFVFHLAAQPLVRDSYDDPKTTFDTNIGGTVNVLESIRSCPSVQAAVVVTSDKCYENREWAWGYRENDPVGGHDPYSASKGAAEIVCAAYLRSYFSENGQGPRCGFATARAGNIIGGGDWAKDRIIPDCVRALSAGDPVNIRNPHAVRPWQHVLDPLAGYLILAQRLTEEPARFSGSWNFGPAEGTRISVLELADQFIAAWGAGTVNIPDHDGSPPHEAGLLKLCIDKALGELLWKPTLRGDAAIDWTVRWYKAWHGGKQHMKAVSLEQIHEFETIHG